MIIKNNNKEKTKPTIEFIVTNSFFSTSFIEHKENKQVTKIKRNKENKNSLSERFHQYISTFLIKKSLPNGDHNA